MSDPLKIFLIGKGAREHALAWKLSQSPIVEELFVLPGNAGTEKGLPKVSNLAASTKDYLGLVELAKKMQINFVVVGPDDEVVGGIEGYFRDAGIPAFAPSKLAAVVEGSKAFSKDFMQRHSIPTAAYKSFSDFNEAKNYIHSVDHRLVIKASGLAAGKGVILPQSTKEAEAALNDIMVKKVFGAAGDSVVIEEFMEGKEISALVLSDGSTWRTLPLGQDAKPVFDGGVGPNTGGMGVYAPVPFATADIAKSIEDQITRPTLEGLKSEGRTFCGLLFIGIMLTSSGPKVLEYNARFGDPETQSVLRLLGDTDLAKLLYSCTNGTLKDASIDVLKQVAINVSLCSGGYPGSYKQGIPIEIKELPEGVIVFHAGTKWDDERLLTAGGRVLTVTAVGDTLESARSAAYKGVESVSFAGMHYRKDIGKQ